MIYIELIYNLATLVALSVVSGFINKRWKRETIQGSIAQGILFGAVAMLGMHLPLKLGEGLIFDGRSVVISLCGFFFGPVSGIIAASMAILLRVLQGGVGAVMGVSVITASFLIGTSFYYYKKKKNVNVTVALLLLLGVIVHVTMLILTFTLPIETAIRTIKNVGLPIITIYPLATLIIGKILSDQEISTRSTEALSKSENLFRSVWEHSKDGMRLTDKDGIIIKVNDAFCRFVGKERNELEGKSLTVIYHESESQVILNQYLINYLNLKITPYFEREFKLWNDKSCWFAVSANYIQDVEKGTLVIASFRDITEKKLSEIALQDSRQMLRKVLDTIPVRVFWKDINLNYIGCNKPFATDAGYNEPEEIKNKNDYEMGWKKEADLYRADDMNVINSKKPKFNYEEPQTKPDGKVIWLKTSKIPLFDMDGNIKGILGTYEDITERKLHEEELRKLSQAVIQSPASVVITNLKGEIEFVNPKVTEVTGYTLEEVKGLSPRLFKSDETPAEEYERLWNNITSGKEWRGEFHNKKKNGELFWEDAYISPIKNEKGETTHYIAIKEDITVRKKMVNDLIISKETAENANKAKSVFLANMSHEIRTPLIGILGYSELIESLINDPELKDMAEKINQSGQRLLTTLNSLLDLSVIESNKLQIKISGIDVGSIINECAGLYNVIAQKKNIKININIPEEKIFAFGDEKLLIQVLNNLVSNAVKYTDKGSITISAETLSVDHKNLLKIKVSDTGIGIPENALSHIFEPFRQVSEGFSREYEGTGLGLAISKKFIEAMKGTIDVVSEVGTGSAFIVTLPADGIISKTKDEKVIIEHKKFGGKKSMQILIVEDDITSRDYMKLVIKNSYNVDAAETGDTAVELCSKNKYDAILLDISLGKGMDGTETLKQIRAIAGYEKVLIAAVTAHAMTGHREMFLSKGFDDYISKPFTKKELLEFLEKLLG